MSDSIEAHGQCLCGKVTVEAKSMIPHMHACHCNMCQQWGGGPFFALDCQQEVNFTGEQYIQRYDSSEWAQRGFCSECGTHLFYLYKAQQQYMMPVGLFPDIKDKIQFESQIFIDRKPGFFEFANKTHNMTEAEVFAQFSGES